MSLKPCESPPAPAANGAPARDAAGANNQVTIELWDQSPAAARRLQTPGSSQTCSDDQDLKGKEQVETESSCVVISPTSVTLESNGWCPQEAASRPPATAVIDLKTVHFSVDTVEGRRSRGVQAVPPDFRLRSVPKLRWTKKCCVKNVFGNVLRVFASQVGMAVFLLVWTLAGAWSFHATEGPREAALGLDVRLMQGRLSAALTDQLHQPNQQHAWKIVEDALQRHEHSVADAINAGYASGGVVWNFAGSLLFAVNMLTTIGFGAPVPRTLFGRTAALIYSAVAIPLHLIWVVNFGALVAENLQKVLVRRRSSQMSDDLTNPTWFSWLPVAAIISHYVFGIVLFGGVVLFPLLFTTAGGVGQRSSIERAVYAVYLECAVIIAGISINVWRISASSGFLSFGLRHNLLARRKD
ncbi:uncharacterized protein LOC132203254 [Neocloeon triangulifer]|uniref:uncharacterized protein LOC132203254 n=1 Tax=Neocloeon triangulifer TaxID=2078957 RepID=UPI00286F0D95|nr:uncharacterized protein LOC132203254 [Neocloeon triangulifer]